ncbi:putative bifunctional diguanylate cyclase/phosphodiesterase [Gluconacetobacter takamatsuzukensis]|uniref:EAL domain-containing protein n=1 Tax=Gluconacetobacter takamatsuzukensis TaxID=1286190 RepID=A0A7W4KFD3_9PROT|nr:EAL domain-containing protein [Gluconacetobacter takamatsuzukensis]MBB2205921.1 EAL domain-containing protein [Gluconacetobacter takamatsuzukensis]
MLRGALTILLSMLISSLGVSAHADPVDLHPSICLDGAPGMVEQLAHSAYSIRGCAGPPRTDGWVWLRLSDPSVLKDLPSGWTLLLDENRFDRISVAATNSDGSIQSYTYSDGEVGNDWAPGGLLRFPFDSPGIDISALSIGFHNLDGAIFIRKVEALAPDDEAARSTAWLVLIGVMIGALASAMVYNLALYEERRDRFQLWYAAWTVLALGYCLSWTNFLGLFNDHLTGPEAVRLSDCFLGAMIAAGTMLLLTLVETHARHRRLLLTGYVLTGLSMVSGFAAAADMLFPPVWTDRLFNGVLVLDVVWIVATIGIAIRRHSRIIWFYLLGWLPVLSVFALRLARNMGFLPQSDAIDMATFAGIAFESIALSVTVAYRLRDIGRARDNADRAIAIMQTEAETLRRAAATDHLTQLDNRAAFQVALDRAEPQATLFLIDVDHLKSVNVSYGQELGDNLLRHMATRLGEIVPPGTILARLGGDEFGILAPQPLEQTVMERLDALQGEPWSESGRTLSLWFSVGQTECHGSPTSAMHRADRALYWAKQRGGGRRQPYTQQFDRADSLAARLLADAPRALAAGEFVLYYQPLIDLKTGRQRGNEALLRWNHPELGLLTPPDFQTLLVDETIGPRLQDEVISIAMSALSDVGDGLAYIAVNFTGVHLRGAAAGRHILNRLQEAGVPPHRLCVEVTEGIALDHASEEIADALNVLHTAGVRTAFDDFGTGYASLVHLLRFPVDIIKIDRSFVIQLTMPARNAHEIVRSIISLGKALDKQVIAEGIETEAQAAILRELGCDYGQGYLFARPGPLLQPPIYWPIRDKSRPALDEASRS